MARFVNAALAALAVFSLVGCGANSQALTGTRLPASTLQDADDDHDVTHAKLNAIVTAVLGEQQAFLMAQVDADKDGAINRTEYARGRAADVVELYFKQFDGNADGRVTGSEFEAAMKAGQAVEAYHHLTEERMGKAIKPYTADKSFETDELRDYMTKDLGLTADWPFIYRLLAELDLNQDDKVLSGPGEGPAFLLKFARPQLQQALAMPVALQAARLR